MSDDLEKRAREWMSKQEWANEWRTRQLLVSLLRAVAAEEREACAAEAERSIIEYAEIDVLDTTPERLRIARRIRARGPR